MANTLDDALTEILAEIATIDGIKQAPSEPPEQLPEFPIVVGFAGRGAFKQGPSGVMTGLHDPRVEIHTSRSDLGEDYDLLIPYVDSIPKELNEHLKDGLFSNLSTWERMDYDLVSTTWGGIQTLAIIFTFRELKIQTTLS